MTERKATVLQYIVTISPAFSDPATGRPIVAHTAVTPHPPDDREGWHIVGCLPYEKGGVFYWERTDGLL